MASSDNNVTNVEEEIHGWPTDRPPLSETFSKLGKHKREDEDEGDDDRDAKRTKTTGSKMLTWQRWHGCEVREIETVRFGPVVDDDYDGTDCANKLRLAILCGDERIGKTPKSKKVIAELVKASWEEIGDEPGGTNEELFDRYNNCESAYDEFNTVSYMSLDTRDFPL